MDPAILHARGFMKEYIFGKMLSSLPQPVNDTTRIKIKGLAERLENVLFKSFTEEYMNLETLQSRFMTLVVRRIQRSRSSQQHANQGGPPHLTGQMPNQGGPPPLQNGSSAAQMQNIGAGAGIGLEHAAGEPADMDPEVLRARTFILEYIFVKMLQQEPQQPVSDAAKMRLIDIANILEHGLFKIALTEYKNVATLQSRFRDLVRRRLINRRFSQMQEPVNLSQRRISASMRSRN